MPKVSDIFDIRYGHSLELNSLKTVARGDGIAFVGRQMGGNGVSAYVELIAGVEPAPAGDLSCALGGNGVLSTFLQPEPFYCGRDVACLRAKTNLTDSQKLFYCMCIKANAYRYSYGRQANRTLREIVVPDPSEVPQYVDDTDVELFEGVAKPQILEPPLPLDTASWKPFLLRQLFDIRKGKRLTKADMKPGSTPFISAMDSNNGLRQRVNAKPMHPANVMTVNYNGNGVAETYYQPEPFFASDDVNVLYPKFELDSASALFICAIIRLEKYRFNYGRKWNLERMNESEIRLPVDVNGSPNWIWMRSYILRQRFSSWLYEEEQDAAMARRRIAEIEANPGTLVQGRKLQSRLSRIGSARTKP